jgi:AraC-like DNA-binding protein
MATVQILAACILLGVITLSVLKGRRGVLLWVWIAFCGSAAASLLLRALGDELGSIVLILLAPASATCGAAWLLARAMFRDKQAVGAVHLTAVAVIAAVNLAPAGPFGTALSALQDLLASTVIVLTLWEAMRGWSSVHSPAERLMRTGFLAATGGAVLIAVVWLGTLENAPGLADRVQTLALIGVTSVAGVCVLFRAHFGYDVEDAETERSGAAPARLVNQETKRLGARLDALVRSESLFLDGDLKVADLARKLQTPEYKITRAITGALEAPNFNQYINRFRIEFACRIMAEDPGRSILAIAFDSGFASIGPFNRAFKALTGQTPRAYRAGLEASHPVTA